VTDVRGDERLSIQEMLNPQGMCFGCGPANPIGLRLRSFVEGDDVVARVHLSPDHQNGYGIANGGIVATLLDCHTGAVLISELNGYDWLQHPPFLTYHLDVSLKRPTPVDTPITLHGRLAERKSVELLVDAEIRDPDGEVTASIRAGWRPVLRRLPRRE
jgi:acyl-coenzyme A thioesterase PaaI-like protein